MNLIEFILLSIALAMDAFAIAICIGLAWPKFHLKKALIVGLYFGIFQAGMPFIGYVAAGRFYDHVAAFDHWIAFGLLSLLGINMIHGALKDDFESDANTASLRPFTMLPLALATSIDALAVGVSFVFLEVNIVAAAAFIGVTTFIVSAFGVKIGHAFGAQHKKKATIMGGVILILLGIRALF